MHLMKSARAMYVASFLGLALYVAIPTLVFAQGLFKQIVPCSGALPNGSLEACTTCHLAELAQNIINTGVILTVFGAALLFAYAGFLYVTGEAFGQVAKARKLLLNVVVGLIVILSAWLIVDIIMKSFLGDSRGSFGPWNDVCRQFPKIS